MTSLAINQEVDSGIKDYISLLKPRVMSLVVFTGFAGLMLAPGNIHPLFALIAIFCIALGSGAAGAINMWYEHELDAKMERTKRRPIPSGRILPENAFDFAVVCAFASVFLMAFAVNFIAAALLLSAILFYVFIYTIWLKPRTPQNIVIGGAAGAFPPVIGWAAVTGNISIEPLLLFLIIFMWTPPHFWALSLYKSDDYRRAGIPMLPVVKGNENTRLQILLYSIALVAITFLPSYIKMSGVVYLSAASVLGAYFLYLATKLYIHRKEKNARALFGYSILYLFALFCFLMLDSALRHSAI